MPPIFHLHTAQARLIKRESRDEIDVLYVQATTAESVPQAADEISNILRQRHRTPIGDDDFTVFTQQDFLQVFETITGVLTIFLGGIAGISLLVGGIGIMNIMLVSVTERTREIGLRKALGARKKDILLQFLTESSLLSLIGGIIGIMFGWLIAFIVGKVATATGNNFTPIVGMQMQSFFRQVSRRSSVCSLVFILPAAPQALSQWKLCDTNRHVNDQAITEI